MNEYECSKGRILYIEPNELASHKVSVADGVRVDNLTWDIEDLQYSVDLMVLRPYRTDCGTVNLDKVAREILKANSNADADTPPLVSFMSGSLLHVKNTETYVDSLTTDFTNVGYQEFSSRGVSSKECLGISSIDINFDSNFFPVVKMRFSDVRGESLFMPSEEAHKNAVAMKQLNANSNATDAEKEKKKSDIERMSASFFSALFHFPYPRFMLTVKGFYGDKVTFVLAVNDFKSSLDAASGNYEINVSFIGYMYGLYTDIPMNIVLYAPFINPQYWEENTADGGRFKFTDGTSIITFQEFIRRYEDTIRTNGMLDGVTLDSNLRLTEESKMKNMLAQIQHHYGLFDDSMKEGCDYLGIPSSTNIVLYSKNSDGNKYFIDETTYNNFVKDLNDFNAAYPDNKIENPLDLSILSLKTDDATKKKYFETNVDALYYDKDTVSNAVKSALAANNVTLESELGFKNSYTHKGLIFPNVARFVSSVTSVINKCDDVIRSQKDQADSELKDYIKMSMGFPLSVENVYRLIFAHVDTFINYFLSVTGRINSKRPLGQRSSIYMGLDLSNSDIPSTKDINSDSFVSPFFAYFKEDNTGLRTAIYPGQSENAIIRNCDEVLMVENIFDTIVSNRNTFDEGLKAIAEAEERIQQYTQSATVVDETVAPKIGEMDFEPICSLDILYNGKNPYDYFVEEFRLHDERQFCNQLVYFTELRLLTCLLCGEKDMESAAKADARNCMKVLQKITGDTEQIAYVKANFGIRDEDITGYLKNVLYDKLHISRLDSNLPYIDNNDMSYKNNAGRFVITDYSANDVVKFGMVHNPNADKYQPSESDFFTNAERMSFSLNNDIDKSYIYVSYNNGDNDSIYDNKPITTYNQLDDKTRLHCNFLTVGGCRQYDRGNTPHTNKYGYTSVYQNLCVNPFINCIDKGNNMFEFSTDGSLIDINNGDNKIQAWTFLSALAGYYNLSYDGIKNTKSSRINIEYKGKALIFGAYLWKKKTNSSYNDIKKVYVNSKVENTKISDFAINYANFDGYLLYLLGKKDDELQDFVKYFEDWVANEWPSVKETLSNTSPDNVIAYKYETSSQKPVYVAVYKNNGPADRLLTELVTGSYVNYINVLDKPKMGNKFSTDFSNGFGAFRRTLQMELGNVMAESEAIEQGIAPVTGEVAAEHINQKRAIYYMLKNLYDRWLCGYTKDSFTLWPKGQQHETRSEFDSFAYVDAFYNDISSRYMMNPSKIIDNINQYLDVANYDAIMSRSVFSFFSKVAQDNKLLFLSLPVFNNVYNLKDVESIFTPHPHYASGSDSSVATVGGSYVLLYAGEVSHMTDNKYYDTDYLDLAGILEDRTYTIPSQFNNNAQGEETAYNIPVFCVSYGKQNQMYFKKIEVNMDNPSVTDYSIMNTIQLSRGSSLGANNYAVGVGGDLFSIYSNRSYTCTVEMMGCMNIMPTMYFQLDNVPMFRGLYYIINVSHNIVPGNAVTRFTGVRISKNSIKVPDFSFDSDSFREKVFNVIDYRYTSLTGEEIDSVTDESGDTIVVDMAAYRMGVKKHIAVEDDNTKIKDVAVRLKDGKYILPANKEYIEKNMLESVTVKVHTSQSDINGTNMTLKMNKKVVEKVKKAFEDIFDYRYDDGRFIIVKGFSDFRYDPAQSPDYKSTSKLSSHSWGLAFDIGNGGQNKYVSCPYDSKKRDTPEQFRTFNHPIVKILAKYGFGWGIYKYSCDYMHFSYRTIPNHIAGADRLIGK